MLRNKLPLLLLLIACGAFAEEKPDAPQDSAITASSGLKARAEAVSKKALQALKGNSDEGENHHKQDGARDALPHLVEIGGLDGHLFATFDMADGSAAEFVPGQSVPKWGRIQAITPGAVERDDHRFFSPEE